MRCSACGTENEAGRKFCIECGTPLARACSACGAANPPVAKFCGECGSPFQPEDAASPRLASTASSAAPSGQAPAAERRLVSLLWGSVQGSPLPTSARRVLGSAPA
jgi:predicted amidophosphoribosyltransferase